jgi:hypothetical protein
MILEKDSVNIVLIIGSGADALRAKSWEGAFFRDIVAINNAWQIRSDWSFLIHPEDFPKGKMPPNVATATQKIITATDYVPIQNHFGGFVYAGATMAFTAGYWALGALKPDVIAFIGCDMVYPTNGATHFYGQGTADPLRADITLQSLEAKSVRLLNTALAENCLCVNLSSIPNSRLKFPKMSIHQASLLNQQDHSDLVNEMSYEFDRQLVLNARRKEADLSYLVPSGKYWAEQQKFDSRALSELDDIWLGSLLQSHAVGIIGHRRRPIAENAQNPNVFG